MKDKARDIEEVLAIYQEELAKFKGKMIDLGIEVTVTASLGKWKSVVEEAEKE